MKAPMWWDQPACDIYVYMRGYDDAIKDKSYKITRGYNFSKPYKAGLLAGIKEVKLLRLLNNDR